MRRRQLIEIEDQAWCPAPVRDGATDYLEFILGAARPYRAIAPRLAAALAQSGADRVVDLCSGGGGPWPTLLTEVRARAGGRPASVVLTDLYPNRRAGERLARRSAGAVRPHPEPVDATRVPTALHGFRTLFSSFHHFPPPLARRILGDAVSSGEGIAVFDVTERRLGMLLGMALVPLGILLMTPALRPFRWSRLFWTYVVPAIPLVGLFDGMVSCLRSYTQHELLGLAADLDGYVWEAGREKVSGLPVAITYLIGVPAPAAGFDRVGVPT